MIRSEFSFPSADGKTHIHAVEWFPEGEIHGVLQIVHGVTEYILRYEPFAQWLTERGFAVVGHDHIGHGESVTSEQPRLYFGEKDGWQYLCKDVYTRSQLARERFSGVPYMILGHSMGSFAVRNCLILWPDMADAAVIMGTGQMSHALIAAGKVLVRREARKHGWTYTSPIIQNLAFGAFNRQFAPNRTDRDWISASTANVDAAIQDPFCNGAITVGLFRDMMDGLEFIGKFKNIRRMNISLPVLLVAGADDPVGENGKAVRRVAALFRKAGIRSVDLKLYPQLRHEILNEENCHEVYQDILNWILAQIG